MNAYRDKLVEAMARAWCVAEEEDPDGPHPEDKAEGIVGGFPLWLFVAPAMGKALDAALGVLAEPSAEMVEAGGVAVFRGFAVDSAAGDVAADVSHAMLATLGDV